MLQQAPYDMSHTSATTSTSSHTATIRQATVNDHAAIASLLDKAFGPSPVSVLVEDLRKSAGYCPELEFVADDNGVVGHILLTRNILDSRSRLRSVLVLSPLSVAESHRGRGIASNLVRTALAVAQMRDEAFIVLEGSPRLYGRFGFVPGDTLGLRRPSLRIPPRSFQAIPIRGGEGGTVVYNEAFWVHDCVGLRDPDLADVEQAQQQ